MLTLLIVCAVLTLVGYYKFVWFMSVGYGLAVWGIGLTLIIAFRSHITPATVVLCFLLMIYGLRLAGFLLLGLNYTGLVAIDGALFETLVYHGIALGFIAMSLRVPSGDARGKNDLTGLKSGAVIVSTYLVQGVTGLLITLGLSYTLLPGMFKAAGRAFRQAVALDPDFADEIPSTKGVL